MVGRGSFPFGARPIFRGRGELAVSYQVARGDSIWYPPRESDDPKTKGDPSEALENQTALHPWRLTWNIIMEVWKIIFLSKWVICMFHVNIPGCIKEKKMLSIPLWVGCCHLYYISFLDEINDKWWINTEYPRHISMVWHVNLGRWYHVVPSGKLT